MSNNNFILQAITTKFIGPSNVRGSRVVAESAGGTKIFAPYDHALSEQENHAVAAMALVEKLKWSGVWIQGGTKTGYCFVNTNSKTIRP